MNTDLCSNWYFDSAKRAKNPDREKTKKGGYFVSYPPSGNIPQTLVIHSVLWGSLSEQTHTREVLVEFRGVSFLSIGVGYGAL